MMRKKKALEEQTNALERKKQADKQAEDLQAKAKQIKAAMQNVKELTAGWGKKFLSSLSDAAKNLASIMTFNQKKPKLPPEVQVKYDKQMKTLEENLNVVLQEHVAMVKHGAEVNALVSKIKDNANDLKAQAKALEELCERLDELEDQIADKANGLAG